MTYSLEPTNRKYFEDMVFCHLQENLEIGLVKNWWILQQDRCCKTAEARGDLIRHKIGDKITSSSKTEKQKKVEKNKTQET